MTLKLALRNVRRSARDYAIYFATIALGVAIFYAFNAISGQAVLLDALSADSQRMIDLLSMMMGVFSILVACVLGFLVVYANRFLVRRRKREFGAYLILGMRPGRVSVILACETFLVGIVALLVGLALGIIASQGLSFVTAALMGTTMSKYQFIVNADAITFTVLCFAAIFVVSAVVDVVYIRRSKLSTLLSAHAGSEQHKTANLPLSIGVFLASLAILACAYWQLKVNGMQQIDEHFAAATALMIVGTFAFFWSVTGFVLALMRRNKNAYLRGTTAFTLRQVSSKINTAFMSMSVVCVLLFFAITSTCVGTGLYDLFVGSMKESTQYDMTLRATTGLLDHEGQEQAKQRFDAYDGDMEACLRDVVPGWDDLAKSTAQLDYYEVSPFAPLLDQVPDATSQASAETLAMLETMPVNVVPLSQYNAVCALTGTPGITLAEDECAVNNTFRGLDSFAQAFANKHASLQVAGSTLHFVGDAQHEAVRTTSMADVTLDVIVPDHVIADLKAKGKVPTYSYLDIMYPCSRTEGDQLFGKAMAAAFPNPDKDAIEGASDYSFANSSWPVFTSYSGQEMANQATGLGMVITYLTIYIGFVLLIATAAVLAVQQLSETTDSLSRYRGLSTIGCSETAVLGSLRTQTLAYFLAPLLVAACHSAWATMVVDETLFRVVGTSTLGGILAAAAMTIVIYGAYLLISLRLSKAMVKQVLV